MPITFSCACGKQLRVADEYAGKRARCPACNTVLEVPAAEAFPPATLSRENAADQAASEENAYKLIDDPSAPPRDLARPSWASRDDAEDRRTGSLAPDTVPRRRGPDGPPRARYRSVEDAIAATYEEPKARRGGGPHVPTILGGLFSMALGGGLCWLRGGISIIGGFLLVAGLISVVKGLLGYEDS